LIQKQIDEATEFQSFGGNNLSVSYDPVTQRFKFKTADSSKEFSLKTGLPAKGLLGLSDSLTPISTYAQTIIPNGDFKLTQEDQRFGIQVNFDEAKRTFSISSGTTGDDSSVSITVPDDESDSPVDNNQVLALLGLKTNEASRSLTPQRGV